MKRCLTITTASLYSMIATMPLTDAVAVELLKGALDSYDVRTIAWLSASRKAGPIPPRFDFTGGVIFVSNRSLQTSTGPSTPGAL